MGHTEAKVPQSLEIRSQSLICIKTGAKANSLSSSLSSFLPSFPLSLPSSLTSFFPLFFYMWYIQCLHALVCECMGVCVCVCVCFGFLQSRCLSFLRVSGGIQGLAHIRRYPAAELHPQHEIMSSLELKVKGCQDCKESSCFQLHLF